MIHKKIISMAVATALMSPWLAAQADIKMSGAIQAEIGSVELADNDRVTTTTDNSGALGSGGGPNRVRFDFSEGLGDSGLTAFGRADWSFNTSSPSGLGDRERYVGLKSSGAYLRLGRIQGAYKTVHKVDPFYSTGGQMRCGGGETCGGDNKAFTHSSFLDNIIELGFSGGGFSASVQAIADETMKDKGGEGMDGSMLLSLKYNTDLFTVYGAYSNKTSGGFSSDSLQNIIDTALDEEDEEEDDLTNWKVGGDFTMGNLTLGLQYEDAEMGTEAMGSTQGQFIAGSAKYKMGNVILGGWVSGFMDDDDIETDELTTDDALSFSVGAIYLFSKKTFVYAAYHETDSDATRDGNEDYYDWNAFAAGIRHSF